MVLPGMGYGLTYPSVPLQAVNDSIAEHRRAALTWFVTAYFVGALGFPAISASVWPQREAAGGAWRRPFQRLCNGARV